MSTSSSPPPPSTRHPTTATASLTAAARAPSSSTTRTSDARQAFLTSLYQASASANVALETRGAIIHDQADKLAEQQKDLDEETKRLRKEVDDALGVLEGARERLGELGREVQSAKEGGEWDEVDEGELSDLEALLDALEEEEGASEGEGQDDGRPSENELEGSTVDPTPELIRREGLSEALSRDQEPTVGDGGHADKESKNSDPPKQTNRD